LKDISPPLFAQVATVGKDHTPHIRTLLVAEISSAGDLLFYSNTQSDKWKDLTLNRNISLCFYNQDNPIQTIVKGAATLVTKCIDPDFVQVNWDKLSSDVRKIYFVDRKESPQAPGNFGMILMKPDYWEFLPIKDPYFKSSKIIFRKSNSHWLKTESGVLS